MDHRSMLAKDWRRSPQPKKASIVSKKLLPKKDSPLLAKGSIVSKKLSPKKDSPPPQIMHFKFGGREETLKVIAHSGNLVAYLSSQSAGCPIKKNTDIQFIKIIGKGVANAPAWLIKIKGMGNKEYVAKVFTPLVETIIVPPQFNNRSLLTLAMVFERKTGISKDLMVALNGGNAKHKLISGQIIYVSSDVDCKLDKEEVYERFDGNGKMIVPANSYLCQNELYSEYPIGVLCGYIYRGLIIENKSKTEAKKVRCINFIDVFGFTTCNQPEKMKQYIFMERITGSIDKATHLFAPTLPNSNMYNSMDIMIIQLLFALCCMQQSYQIQHNDLHPGNMFFERITDETIYHGQKLSNADYLQYTLFDKEFYLPNIGYLMKIGDFGLSVKYKKPIIGNKETFMTGYNQDRPGQTRILEGPWIPNWYSKVYDMIYACGRTSKDSYISREVISFLQSKIGDTILNNGPGENTRPKLKYLEKLEKYAPENMLMESLFDNFRIVPNANQTTARVGMIRINRTPNLIIT